MDFNWDDIELDNSYSHNSRFYFDNRRRSKHERRCDVKEQQQNPENENFTGKVPECEDKENHPSNNSPSQESSSHKIRLSSIKVENFVESQQPNGQDIEEGACCMELLKVESDCVQPEIQKTENNELDQLCTLMENSPNIGKKAKIVTPSKFVKKEEQKVGAHTPKAFQYHQAYQAKRNAMLRKRQEEEEQNMHKIQSRPMPNFDNYKPLKHIHVITLPTTPLVLKRSLASQKKKQELRTHDNAAPGQHPISALAPPIRPYNLRCEKRLQERRKYDEEVQRKLEEKQKEEEERRKLEEAEQIKQIRKATAFKARPNPKH